MLWCISEWFLLSPAGRIGIFLWKLLWESGQAPACKSHKNVGAPVWLGSLECITLVYWSLQQFVNHSWEFSTLALVVTEVSTHESTQVSRDTLYSPFCHFNLRATVCPVSSHLLWIQEELFISLFSFLLVRTDWWCPNCLHVGMETGNPFRKFYKHLFMLFTYGQYPMQKIVKIYNYSEFSFIKYPWKCDMDCDMVLKKNIFSVLVIKQYMYLSLHYIFTLMYKLPFVVNALPVLLPLTTLEYVASTFNSHHLHASWAILCYHTAGKI